jgi:RNA polymerase sigma factor (sigma-70 family)
MPDEAQVERLVVENQRLVEFVVNRTLRRRPVGAMEREDLVSWGSMGLLQAARVWDPRRGLAFSTLAVRVIERMINRGIRKEAATCTVRATLSLDELLDGGESAEGTPERHLDQMRGDADIEQAVMDAEDRLALEQAVAELKPEEQWVLRQRFYEERTLEEIARQIGKTRQAVHLRERAILRTLRRRLQPPVPEPQV